MIRSINSYPLHLSIRLSIHPSYSRVLLVECESARKIIRDSTGISVLAHSLIHSPARAPTHAPTRLPSINRRRYTLRRIFTFIFTYIFTHTYIHISLPFTSSPKLHAHTYILYNAHRISSHLVKSHQANLQLTLHSSATAFLQTGRLGWGTPAFIIQCHPLLQ